MEFMPEHWTQIKEYAGIYSITTHWDLTKLDNNELEVIISYIAKNEINNYKILKPNYVNNLISFIWAYLNKSKLYNIYEKYKHKLCSNEQL